MEVVLHHSVDHILVLLKTKLLESYPESDLVKSFIFCSVWTNLKQKSPWITGAERHFGRHSEVEIIESLSKPIGAIPNYMDQEVTRNNVLKFCAIQKARCPDLRVSKQGTDIK